MDLAMASRYHDTQHFDTYNFTDEEWDFDSFIAQLKRADTFVSIWNRPTRKRALQCSPGNDPTSPVIRVNDTGELFMVGSFQGDSKANNTYRHVYNLHEVAGEAVLTRKVPAETAGIKGWAVDTVIQNTFADAEMRSVNENLDAKLEQFGHFFLFLPSNCPAAKHDVVSLNGKNYYIIETYLDSGLVTARTTTRPDERVNLVYLNNLSNTYNPATQQVTPGGTSYNVTAKVEPLDQESLVNSEVVKKHIKVVVQESFISFDPMLEDKVTWESSVYTVKAIKRVSALSEWHLICQK